jgi:hypothetical protein
VLLFQYGKIPAIICHTLMKYFVEILHVTFSEYVKGKGHVEVMAMGTHAPRPVHNSPKLLFAGYRLRLYPAIGDSQMEKGREV